MRVHREVHLKSGRLADEQIVEVLRRFGQQVTGWSFMQNESEEYSRHMGAPSCMLVLHDGQFQPAVALTKKREGVYYVANIVPGESDHIPMTEYSTLARRFTEDFRRFARSEGIPISISVSDDNAGLTAIIPSPKARQFFERYLHGYPTSYHPNDIKRLDIFICAASRYCRRDIELDRLQTYLVEDLKWSAKDARWCRDRIEAGLDLLQVNRRF
jgi:hypothetical protein